MTLIQKLLGYKDLNVDDIVDKQLENDEQALIDYQEDVEQPTILGEVSFKLTTAGDLNIQIQWGESQSALGQADIFGEFLHHICSGRYKDLMEQVVIKMAVENISYRLFVQNTLSKWNELIENQADMDDEPAINPLAVFNLTQTQSNQSEEETE